MRHHNIGNRLFIATITLICGFSADTASALSCPVERVPTIDVAKNIFIAVANNLSPRLLKRFPIVKASDRGDHWAMSQENNAPSPLLTEDQSYSMVDSLILDIDKCTGVVSHAARVRTKLPASQQVY